MFYPKTCLLSLWAPLRERVKELKRQLLFHYVRIPHEHCFVLLQLTFLWVQCWSCLEYSFNNQIRVVFVITPKIVLSFSGCSRSRTEFPPPLFKG